MINIYLKSLKSKDLLLHTIAIALIFQSRMYAGRFLGPSISTSFNATDPGYLQAEYNLHENNGLTKLFNFSEHFGLNKSINPSFLFGFATSIYVTLFLLILLCLAVCFKDESRQTYDELY